MYESLRSFVPPRPRDPSAPAPEAAPQEDDHRVSVMSWLAGVGHAIARKLRPAPPAPLARIHARR